MRLLSSLLLLCWLAAAHSKQPLPAKQPPAATADEPATFTAETRWVILPVSVSDKNGKLITDLQEKSFKVFENGVEQPIKLFRHEDVPRIDSRGGTAMREAINMSIDYLKEKGKNHKKVLLVVTDGNDNASTIGLERLVDRARQSEVLLYAIGLLDEEERREAKAAKRALNALTQESGGLAFYPKGVTEVDAIALQVAHEIRNQYTIAYSPLNDARDGSFRQIKVTVNGPGHPQVRTRTGYYATADRDSKKAGSSTP